MTYNWQHPNWPHFTYDTTAIDACVSTFTLALGEVKGILDILQEEEKEETLLQFMIDEAIKTSEIEGEFYSRQDILSSIKNKIGLATPKHLILDKRAEGISELMIEVRSSHDKPLSEILLQTWHRILFAQSFRIEGGQYRQGEHPMQIVSGAHGKETIHYEAPPSIQIHEEMQRFVQWYSQYSIAPLDFKSALIKTAICHLYFESIHPFEDGNGRIGRALAEKCLAESFPFPLVLSLSKTIEKDKKVYYSSLKEAQRSLDITNWIIYFTGIIVEAQQQAKQTILFTINKAHFFNQYTSQLNERQHKVMRKMFDFGLEDFTGSLSAKKYQSMTKTSKATATRDLQDLVEKKILVATGAGRSVRYNLNVP
ncbi:Fic family protein [Myroides fluvii]|uniref:Fic family protein n=1 Tax=Myroides fluvii TaxID=2572594 RepID=UPI00131D901B|nr:Fic family protein [Myroides fluvii]